MNEIGFRRLVIILVIIGLLLLIARTIFFQPKQLSISQALSSTDFEVVSISGIIKNLNVESDYLYFDLCEHQKCIKSILFNPNKIQSRLIQECSLSKDTVILIGKLEEYRENVELIIYSLE